MKKKGFQHAPFKSLKGASVFPEHKPARHAPGQPPAPAEEEPDFQTAMEQLGVTPTRQAQPGPDPESPAPVELEGDGEALFLERLVRFDKLFRDELPADEEPQASASRRTRQLRRGRIAPEAELDLHGSDRASALARLGHFLDNARFHGLQCVLVITGRGNRSAEGPVLRDAVEAFLAGPGREQVVEWCRAPRQQGGDGALVVFLRGR